MKTTTTAKWIATCISLSLLLALGACEPDLPEEVQAVYDTLPEHVDFNFHIRPILADRCFSCHGPDENTREAGLRLDLEADAFAQLSASGSHALVKGSLRKSQAWQRIASTDAAYMMPPPKSNLKLSTQEKALIAKWIQEGAKWKEHWAFIPPEKKAIPVVDTSWGVNPIDNYVLKKMQTKGLSPSERANKERIIRRLSFDLRGLPPSLEEISDFLADTSSLAYEGLVNRFLESESHAERMAMEWLDVARFGDTQGLHVDPERYNWPWRDWVIQAFKENLPYDDFITWQLAGDLLPSANRQQKLATAFHRNHPTSSEGGIPNEEFRQKYVQDRTNTTATAFLGLTLECATCHDHKFDPLSQKEYYQMSAFFNNLNELGMVNEFRMPGGKMVYASGPVMLLPEEKTEEELSRLKKAIEELEQKQESYAAELLQDTDFVETLKKNPVPLPKADGAFPFESLRPYKIENAVVHRIQNRSPINKIIDNNVNSLACGDPELVPGMVGKALRFPKEMDIAFIKDLGNFENNESYTASAWFYAESIDKVQTILGTSGQLGSAWRGWDLFLDSLNRPSIKMVSVWPHNYMQITAEEAVSKETWTHLSFSYDGSSRAEGLTLFVNGQRVKSHTNHDHLYTSIVNIWRSRPGWQLKPIMVGRSGRFHTGENGVFQGMIDEIRLYKRQLSALEIAALYENQSGKKIDAEMFTPADYLQYYLLTQDQAFDNFRAELQELRMETLALMEEVPEIMVMEDQPIKRKTFVLSRGQYDKPLEEVEAGTPSAILTFDASLPKNRLGLASWITDPQNPLTARVAVNRYWQMLFGRGIVDTPHDFGTQGALPSHPELLDWLALEFIASDWNLRALLKRMVMSATYRQSSRVSYQVLEKDPDNVFLSRGPSHRLQAEMIRDNALAASGLLNPKIGGPSVRPYQPEGIWDFGGHGPYEIDSIDNLYRRSMYTFIRRTSPHPAMVAFDAPNRLVCTTKRENTNTPLQALVLLNDPQFVEAARVLAQRMLQEGGDSLEARAQYGFRLLCGRIPDEQEKQLMRAQYQVAWEKFQERPEDAEEFLDVGEYPLDPDIDKIQTAALAVLANTLMNFDEAYMKR